MYAFVTKFGSPCREDKMNEIILIHSNLSLDMQHTHLPRIMKTNNKYIIYTKIAV